MREKRRHLLGHLIVSITLLVQFFHSQGAFVNTLNTFAGGNGAGFTGDAGPAASSQIDSPYGAWANSVGVVYLVDYGNYRIRMVASGIISTIFGDGTATIAGDGSPATSASGNPFIVTGDTLGNIYFLEYSGPIRKIDLGGIVTTIAGDGASTTEGNVAADFDLDVTTALAVDNSGNIYFYDFNLRKIHRIDGSTNIVTAIAGDGNEQSLPDSAANGNGDGGPAANSILYQVIGFYYDRYNNYLYFNSKGTTIRKINLNTNIITLVAGVGDIATADGDGSPAVAAHLSDGDAHIAGDIMGNIYFVSASDNTIRKIDTSGIINAFAGTGSSGYTGDGSDAASGTFDGPIQLAVNWNTLYVSDKNNNAIRSIAIEVSTSHPTSQPSTQPSSSPTTQPSSQPSIQPSSQPSSRPSTQPSTQPTSRPSTQPSAKPSNQPSNQPSARPSTQPSARPSCQPSTQPSSRPSSQPSSRPSTQPSLQPSMRPSSQPTGSPTDQPTGRPSNQPTGKPSMQPTCSPTTQPSSSPTIQPSNQPSMRPSSQPSSRPSTQPTTQPSSRPTCQPSGSPTDQPTGKPSNQPTGVPSMQPSASPTDQPSSRPSTQPTTQPSSRPTCQPSGSPTDQPTGKPSNQPTGVPSMQPSASPTTQPSGSPTDQPTSRPSDQPTMMPSMQPTCSPTTQPSSSPTMQPSSQPTSIPSTQPSCSPTNQPSGSPTGQPSSVPSMQPTCSPTTQPSARPSSQPSALPTMQPSSQPTFQPSNDPSMQPTGSPTSQPSRRPSSQPSSSPTCQPSRRPTSQPSRQPTSQPSRQPTRVPSTQPSRQPSSQPSASPTRQPTGQPSRQPSTQPSSNPTSPTSQPTGSPTGPTPKPTKRPTKYPTSIPTGQPSAQPTSQPTSPTGQPSSAPSFDWTLVPHILDKYSLSNFTYKCHPTHRGSVPNGFKRIFYGLTINSTVYMDHVKMWMEPFDPVVDQLSMSSQDYTHNLIGNATGTNGVLLMTNAGPEVTKFDWNDIINMPTYRLNIDHSRQSCPKYTKGQYDRTFYIQATDRYGRVSNTVQRKLWIKTSVLMFGTKNPQKITNSQPYVSVVVPSLQFREYPGLKYSTNITSGD